ncbi:MAG: PDZ domain-containing protein [Candidatus Anammoxibacter sp.]
MKTTIRINLFALICLVLVFASAFKSYGYTLLSGITLADGDNGIIVFEIKPGTPAKNAGIRKGDVIFKIGEKEIKGIRDYLQYSGTLINREQPVRVFVKRRGRILTFLVEDFSIPVNEFWDEKVSFPRAKIPKGEEPYSYWVARGKSKLASAKGSTSYKQTIAIYQTVITNLFYALHYNPKMVITMVLIADTYKKIGETAIKYSLKKEVVVNFNMSVRLYKKAMVETSISKESLNAILKNLKDIEHLLRVRR